MPDRTGQQIGNYRLVKLLGKGAFAEVYLGQHIHIHKQAAIKVLHEDTDQKAQDMFLQEAENIEKLKHPHIIRILDFGRESRNNAPYLIMEYASGGTLRQRHPQGSRLSPKTIVPYIQQVSSALQYAHDRRLIHRDVKPENILLGQDNEILLSDFGIAAIAHSEHSLGTQEMAGTIPYMAPEQIKGKPRPASDQYALGIIVYEWLCGVRPFQGAQWEIAQQHLSTPPPSLRENVSSIHPAIEAVVLKALTKDPRERFGDVREFAQRLEAEFLASIALTVIPPKDLEDQPGRIQTIDVTSQSTVIYPAEELTETVYAAHQITVLPPVVKPIGTTLSIYREHWTRVRAVAWSPNGKFVASASGFHVHVWDALTATQRLTYSGHLDTVTSIAWSPDGKFIASGSHDKTVRVWEATTGNTRLTYKGHSGWLNLVYSVAWSPDGKYIVSSSHSKIVHVWDAATGALKLTYRHGKPVESVAWSPDGRFIVSGGHDGTVLVWDAATGNTCLTYKGHSGWVNTVNSVAWSPDGKFIASGSNDETVQIWDAVTGEKHLSYEEYKRLRVGDHRCMVYSVAWSPDGKYIASSCWGARNNVRVWEALTGISHLNYPGHHGFVYSVAWSPDGKYIASGGFDDTAQMWVASECELSK